MSLFIFTTIILKENLYCFFNSEKVEVCKNKSVHISTPPNLTVQVLFFNPQFI